MAINPNTDFTAGQVLTAAEQNRFPRGIVAFVESTSSSASISAQAVTLTAPAFTAVANRYYKITYFEPVLQPSGPPGFITARLRLNDVSGTELQFTDLEPVVSTGSDGQFLSLTLIKTFTAGSTVICATLQASTNTVVAYGSSTARRQIIVEDIGPA